MPMNLIPTHACAIVLYGREACARFEALVEYFSGILEPRAWDQFLFILIDRQSPPLPALPAEPRVALMRSCWQMDIDTLQSAGKPEEIITGLRNRIHKNNVLLQCVCAAYEDLPAPPEALLAWLDGIQQEFTPGTIRTIAYLLLRDDQSARQRQSVWAQAFADHTAAFPYLYLLSDCASDTSTVSPSSLWHAVYGELLANSATCRTLSTGVLFSLGLSTLNANDGELTAIRRDFLSCLLRERASRTITRQEGWEMLTHSQTRCPEPDGPEMGLALGKWLDTIVTGQIVLPNEAERSNLRLFAGFPQAPPEQLENGIQRFYQANNGTREASGQAALRYAEQYVLGVLETLGCINNTPGFPLALFTQIEDSLAGLAAAPIRSYQPEKQPPRRFPPRAKRTQAAMLCHAIEAECERVLLAEQVRCYAAAFRQAFGKVRSFILAAGALRDDLEKDRVPSGTIDPLLEKYKHYTATVRDTVEARGERLVQGAPQLTLFGPDGTPEMDHWRQIIDYGVEALRCALPAVCAGSFCQTVHWECSAREGLNQFFGEYLGESKRMLCEPADVSGTPQSLYFSDAALSGHPWFDRARNDTVVAHNDNVERVDLFPLQKDLDWYQHHNRYFLPGSPSSSAASGLTRLWNGEPATPPAQVTSPKFSDTNSAPTDAPADTTPDHRLAIMVDHGRHVLVWEWENGVESAVVSIFYKNLRVQNMVYTVEQYNAPVGGLPNGVDVTDGLPYGPVRVEIKSSKGLYAAKTLAGRKNEVRYRFESARDRLALVLEGTPSDICKLALRVPRPGDTDKVVYYPLSIWESSAQLRIKGLQHVDPANCLLDTLPGDAYPTVHATPC
ncbi:MAG: hypothetical protein LLF96_07585 [Eubacteriales bacterium]|nr:hypothetical protein [Eubacteriales bacterium]